MEAGVASGMIVEVGNTGLIGADPLIVIQEIIKIRIVEVIKAYRFMECSIRSW